jgi:hypothetical protein
MILFPIVETNHEIKNEQLGGIKPGGSRLRKVQHVSGAAR